METIRIAGLSALKWSPTKRPNGRSILFVHGWWGGAWVWDRFGPWFADLGFECFAIDLSKSDASPANGEIGSLSFYEHLNDVLQVSKSLNRPILIGHSVGGLLAQKMAETEFISACVGIVPAAPRGINSLVTLKLVRFFLSNALKMIFSRPFLPSQARMCEMDLNGLSRHEQRLTYERMVAASGRQGLEIGVLGIPVHAARITVPILIIGGELDNLTPPRLTRRIAKKYNADYREYEGRGHYLMRENNWQQIAADIAKWLELNL